jgi:hypothetical protein
LGHCLGQAWLFFLDQVAQIQMLATMTLKPLLTMEVVSSQVARDVMSHLLATMTPQRCTMMAVASGQVALGAQIHWPAIMMRLQQSRTHVILFPVKVVPVQQQPILTLWRRKMMAVASLKVVQMPVRAILTRLPRAMMEVVHLLQHFTIATGIATTMRMETAFAMSWKFWVAPTRRPVILRFRRPKMMAVVSSSRLGMKMRMEMDLVTMQAPLQLARSLQDTS